jgi:predicted nuclease of restriction endonuclease-like (RecB) superfamily
MRVENQEARNYYLSEAAQQQWSVRTLERNINTFYFQRLLSNQNEVNSSLETINIKDFIKDPYVFEFLNIPEMHQPSEKELEQNLISKLSSFVMEMGKGFSFVGNQYRISTEAEHFYIDLVFYNYILKCFVLIDLKMGKLTHQDIGQMDMYRRMFDDFKKPEGDNPTIGILLCTEKSETVVKYSIMKDIPQLFASKYKLYIPTEQQLIAEIEHQKAMLNLRNHE